MFIEFCKGMLKANIKKIYFLFSIFEKKIPIIYYTADFRFKRQQKAPRKIGGLLVYFFLILFGDDQFFSNRLIINRESYKINSVPKILVLFGDLDRIISFGLAVCSI